MINLEKDHCCGCSACVNICPQNCISMDEDEEGFLYPQINKELCVQCDLCSKICPVLNLKIYSSIQKSFVGFSKNEEVRIDSSSGGIFSILAEDTIKHSGYVFGAGFDESFMGLQHISISEIDKLEKLRGSKYLQSKIGYSYKTVKELLESGKRVLFSGTACQIAGIRAFLKKDYENLVLVDILCHGVPSPKLWRKYLTERHIKPIEEISFRYKGGTNWQGYKVFIKGLNQDEYCVHHDKDEYMRLFISNICLRPSCHICKFKDINRPSDITIGDCWSVMRHSPEMDDGKGVSLLILHTDKGLKILEENQDMIHLKAMPVDELLPPDDDARNSVIAHHKRELFFKKLQKGDSIQKLVCLLDDSLKVRIRTKLRALKRKIYR